MSDNESDVPWNDFSSVEFASSAEAGYMILAADDDHAAMQGIEQHPQGMDETVQPGQHLDATIETISETSYFQSGYIERYDQHYHDQEMHTGPPQASAEHDHRSGQYSLAGTNIVQPETWFDVTTRGSEPSYPYPVGNSASMSSSHGHGPVRPSAVSTDDELWPSTQDDDTPNASYRPASIVDTDVQAIDSPLPQHTEWSQSNQYSVPSAYVPRPGRSAEIDPYPNTLLRPDGAYQGSRWGGTGQESQAAPWNPLDVTVPIVTLQGYPGDIVDNGLSRPGTRSSYSHSPSSAWTPSTMNGRTTETSFEENRMGDSAVTIVPTSGETNTVQRFQEGSDFSFEFIDRDIEWLSNDGSGPQPALPVSNGTGLTRYDHMIEVNIHADSGMSRQINERRSVSGDFLRVAGPPSPTVTDISTTPSQDPALLQCPENGCDAEFRGEYRRGNLHRHLRLKHAGAERLYHCEAEGCGRSFRRQDARLKHYRNRHPALQVAPAQPRPRSRRSRG